jgi:VanZ family protein
MRAGVLRWIPAALWMFLIYSASTDTGSVGHTRPIVARILEQLFPVWYDSTPLENIKAIDWMIRKCAHVTEYAVLTSLVAYALSGETRHRLKTCLIWSIPIAYAVTDEWHQSTVPSRWATPWDVGIDSIGTFLAMILLRLIERKRKSKL